MERNTLRLEILGQVTPRTLAEVLSHLQGLLDGPGRRDCARHATGVAYHHGDLKRKDVAPLKLHVEVPRRVQQRDC